ncbi:MAG TPA: helix-turn-helix domain-containing protein [Arsenophonus nasoniae]|uniref:helix-turn-helix domain-containing protein n=1 Tax=Arsenophonus nasoniae TaxID=638 RepID=UPI00387A1E26
MSIDYAKKLLAIRKAEGLTQQKFSEITGLSLGFIKIYESGHRPARSETIEKVLQIEIFEKYTLWLITDKVAPEAGQIEPAFSLDGSVKSKTKRKVQSFLTEGKNC